MVVTTQQLVVLEATMRVSCTHKAVAKVELEVVVVEVAVKVRVGVVAVGVTVLLAEVSTMGTVT